MVLCECGCGTEIISPKWGRTVRFAHGHYLNVKNPTKPREKHQNWKGGKRISSNGYVMVLLREHPRAEKATGYVREHVLVLEKHLNACILKWAHIHHKNGIKTDNRVENLELISNSKHQHIHHKGIKRIKEKRVCYDCNGSYRERWRKINNKWHCVICANRIERHERLKNTNPPL